MTIGIEVIYYFKGNCTLLVSLLSAGVTLAHLCFMKRKAPNKASVAPAITKTRV